MELKQIQELIKAVNKSELSELTIKDGDFEITIKQSNTQETQVVTVAAPAQQSAPAPQPVQQAAPAPAPEAAQPATPQPAADNDANLITVKSPMIGTFYRSPKPEEPPFVNVGDTINEGEHICIIEAMKLFNEIESEVTGKIVKVLIDDASPVEYDQPLFLVDPS